MCLEHVERFSTWKSLVRASIRAMLILLNRFRRDVKASDSDGNGGDVRAQAMTVIIKATQQEVFINEMQHLFKVVQIPRESRLEKWSAGVT